MVTDYAPSPWESLWADHLIPRFEAETDIRIQAHFLPTGTDRFHQLIDANEWPDLNSSTFGRVCSLDAHDDVESVTEIVERARAQNGEMTARPHARTDESVQVPYGYQAETFLYREDIYEQLGLNVPTTFREVIENAKAIDDSADDVRGYGLAGGTFGEVRRQPHGSRACQAYLARMGVPPTGLRWQDPEAREELEIHFPETEVTALLEHFEALTEYSPPPPTRDGARTMYRWIEGQVAQTFHVNNWPVGLAAEAATSRNEQIARRVAESTGVAPLPYWSAGGVGRADAWLGEPELDAFHLFTPGRNTDGARRWLEWLFTDELDRTARLYTPEPTRYLPNYAAVLEADIYRNQDLFRSFPRLLEQVEFIQETVVGQHYGQRVNDVVDSPAGLYVKQQPLYGEMVRRVVSGESAPEGAYEYGRQRLTDRLEEARERF